MRSTRARRAGARVTWTLLAAGGLLAGAGCDPGPTGARGQGASSARGEAVERRQAQEKLEAVAAAASAEEQRAALEALTLWLNNPRPWRASGYRVRLRPPEDGAVPLTAAEVAEAKAAAEAPTLVVEVPELDGAATVTFHEAAGLGVLEGVLAGEE